jgi:hypothetical protein
MESISDVLTSWINKIPLQLPLQWYDFGGGNFVMSLPLPLPDLSAWQPGKAQAVIERIPKFFDGKPAEAWKYAPFIIDRDATFDEFKAAAEKGIAELSV